MTEVSFVGYILFRVFHNNSGNTCSQVSTQPRSQDLSSSCPQSEREETLSSLSLLGAGKGETLGTRLVSTQLSWVAAVVVAEVVLKVVTFL